MDMPIATAPSATSDSVAQLYAELLLRRLMTADPTGPWVISLPTGLVTITAGSKREIPPPLPSPTPPVTGARPHPHRRQP